MTVMQAIYTYVYVCVDMVHGAGYKKVCNKARQCETQHINETDLIHDIMDINHSSS